jgi:hypothetical protein
MAFVNLTGASAKSRALLDNVTIGLFIPCSIDPTYPEVGIPTLELLERFGLHVHYRSSNLLRTTDVQQRRLSQRSAPAREMVVSRWSRPSEVPAALPQFPECGLSKGDD